MGNARNKRSYELVDYALRPKKQIERKVIIEILGKMKSHFGDYSNRRYIGLGSVSYYDFLLFHKYLDFKKLTSIDKDESRTKRFEFNKPYDFVKFHPKSTTVFLKEFDWKESLVIWLDYDCSLTTDVIEDLKLVGQRSQEGDILIVTVNQSIPDLANSDEDDENDQPEVEENRKRMKRLRETFMETYKRYLPNSRQGLSYATPKEMPITLKTIILNAVKEGLLSRNPLKYHGLFTFDYADGARMFTIGGVFTAHQDALEKLDSIEFVSRKDEITRIDVPCLTHKEKIELDSRIEEIKMMVDVIEKKYADRQKGVIDLEITKFLSDELPFEIKSANEIRSYIKFYKYYPQYYEGII